MYFSTNKKSYKMKTKNNQTFVSIDYNNQSFEKNKTSPCIHQTLIFSLGAFTLTTTASLYLHQIMESTNFNLAEFLAKILVFLPILTLVYVFTRNCSKTDKHISVLYFKFAIFSGILGILLSIYLRFSEVIAFNNFLKCTNYAFYEIVFCGCTVILAFFFCMSVLLGGFGIRYVPVLLGRSRTYFPKINYISYILLILSFSMFILSLGFAIFSQNDLVINLSYLKVYIVDFLIWSLYLFGMSYFLLSINLILTIGKGLKRIIPPLFVQTMMVTSILMLCFIPLLIGIVTKTLLVSQLNFMNFNIVIENSTGGKEILSWAYLFWCGVHPAIFIFILPTLGIISQIVTYHYKPNNSNYITLSINICLMGITGVSYCGFYLFTLNKIINIESYFFFLQLIVIYSILAFNVSLLFTLRGASINTLNTSSLFVIGCILTFFINASCEFVLSIYKGKQILFDGFFLETQLQYLLFISVLYAIFAGIYFCFKDIFGVSYNETLGRIHFWSFFFWD
jgi:cytochrome c oxidase subunit 1